MCNECGAKLNSIICSYWLSWRARQENIWLKVMVYMERAQQGPYAMTKSQIHLYFPILPEQPVCMNSTWIVLESNLIVGQLNVMFGLLGFKYQFHFIILWKKKSKYAIFHVLIWAHTGILKLYLNNYNSTCYTCGSYHLQLKVYIPFLDSVRYQNKGLLWEGYLRVGKVLNCSLFNFSEIGIVWIVNCLVTSFEKKLIF